MIFLTVHKATTDAYVRSLRLKDTWSNREVTLHLEIWLWLHSDASVFVTLLFGSFFSNWFELIYELGLRIEQLKDFLNLLHVFWPINWFLLYFLEFLVALLPCSLISITLFILLIFICLLLSNFTKCQMILQPLILVFIINKVRQ